MKKWRFIDTGIISASENMALDECILCSVDSEEAPNTFRIMRFSPTCVLVGRNQNVFDEVNLDYCNDNDIPVNRRITGGGAILMQPSTIGWELVARKDILPGKKIEDIYRFLCGGVVDALNTLGVDAAFRPHNDIEVNGRKISGTGGTEYGDTFLFHGTILVDFDIESMLKCLNTPLEKLQDKGISIMEDRLTWLKNESAGRIIKALRSSFSSLFRVEMQSGSLTPGEKRLLEEREAFFKSDSWIFGLTKQKTNHIFKAPGGTIRVFPVINRGYISSIIITGDFFAYPSRLIPDLEGALKNCRVKDIRERIKKYFYTRDWDIPGVTPDDFILAIESALK